MSRLFREPLLHFLLIGAGFFALYLALNPAAMESDDRIVVTPERIEMLATNFEKTWRRPPDAGELKTLVNGFVVEEVLYRQALALGIDKNDPVIRHRLRQKMAFYTDEVGNTVDPTPTELTDYLARHADRYQRPAVFAFEQVFLRLDRPGAELDARIDRVMAQLAAGEPVPGESSLLPRRFDAVSTRDVARTFGSAFAESLNDVPLDRWNGPLQSGLGIHFVRITERTPARTPALAEVRQAVERDWRHDRNAALKKAFENQLISDYDVVIKWPDDREPRS